MSIKQQLDLARRELLDMGMRANPLLNFRHNAKTLEVFDERSTEVFQLLVQDKKAMSFLPVPEVYEDDEDADDEEGAEPLPPLADYLAETVGEDRYTDTYLQTHLKSDKLDKALLKIENEAHMLLQEQGIDVLFLALGFLEWYEDPNAQTPRRAPLILVPVELVRSSASDSFRITYTGAELAPNVVLTAKLKGDFRLEVPGFEEELDVMTYLEEVQRCVAGQPRWKVLPDQIALGLFSFGKFQMYADLDAENWPEEKSPVTHPLLNQLLKGGFQKDGELIEGVASHVHLREPEALHLVKDSDSSQTEAILAVMGGANAVIQGPPGTGKSQTITNIIAEAVSRGKKVLFVAQKLAALEVVKQRLDECHLGDAVLELHSHKSTKKAVLDSLRSTFEQGKPKVPDRNIEIRRLKDVRSQLNEYVGAVSRPLLDSGINYVQALGKLLKLRGIPGADNLVELPFSLMETWDPETLLSAERALAAIAEHISQKGVPADSPFSMSLRDSLSPTEQQTVSRIVVESRELLSQVWAEAQRLAEEMMLPVPESLHEVGVLHRAANRALQAPHLKGVRLTTDEWQLRRDVIRQTLSAGAEMSRIRVKHQGRFIDAAYKAAVLAIRQGFVGRVDKWWRIFSGPYRRAKTAYRGLLKQGLEGKPVQWLSWIDDLLTFQEQEKVFQEYEQLCQTLFGAQWQGKNSDWEVLSQLSEWIIELYQAIGKGEIPKGVADFLEGEPSLGGWEPRLQGLQESAATLEVRLNELVKLLEVADDDQLRKVASVSMEKWSMVLEGWQQTDSLYDLVRFNQLEANLEPLGLSELGSLCFEWRQSPELLPVLLKISYYSGLVNYAYSQFEHIRRFDRISHEQLIKEFKELDESLLGFSQEALVARLFASLPNVNAPGEMELVRRELNKSRRHIPIRRLIAEATTVIQQAKPVFMMSPMSISTYLAQGKIEFDLVIFDEASQIPAPDALGAVLRGKQLVVVGDSKQMPPTNFFGRAVELDEEEAEESSTADIESILGMMLAKGVPEVMLRWHYRSRHHSLIAVSNQEFYSNKLLVFPSPGVHPLAMGLRFRFCPDAYYDRGGSRSNIDEARLIAEAVIMHARENPTLSLGVVAFSTAQRDAIVLEVERLRREHPDTESFFEQNSARDEFFVKNLENVQGDERDVIYISIGYGRTASGTVSRSFGPLNKSGGERRLNVLISRARLAMEVFANFKADELKTDSTSPIGVRALKAFLKYAETGELEVSEETGREADSPFEEAVHEAIAELGYDVEAQVGCQGFFIDLAVRDPAKPGRYILAVECDGASYHSSAAARDRDRLRQAVLEGLGWRFHRIWSTDWFRNQAAEIQRLKEAIEKSIAHYQRLDELAEQPAQKPKQEKAPASVVRIERTEAKSTEGLKILPYQETPVELIGLGGFASFEEIPTDQVAQAVEVVVRHEAPINLSLLCARLTAAAGFSRAGVRIRSRIEDIVYSLEREGRVREHYEFVWNASVTDIPLRDWSVLGAAHRKFDYLADEELQQALLLTVKDALSIGMDDCIGAALNLLGFRRVTIGIRVRMEDLANELVESGRLCLEGERLKLAG